MALSDQWTLGSFRTTIRQDLLDSGGKWWGDAELSGYINDWQQLLQSQFELVWGTASLVTSSATVTLTSLSTGMLRVGRMYWTPGGTDTSTYLLPPLGEAQLEGVQEDWVAPVDGGSPRVTYQKTAGEVVIWPPPPSSGTLLAEFPVACTFTTDTSTLQLPAWVKYSCTPYVCWRALSRFGPNQNQVRASRYRKDWDKQYGKIRKIWDAHFPLQGQKLKPAGRGLAHNLNPRGTR